MRRNGANPVPEISRLAQFFFAIALRKATAPLPLAGPIAVFGVPEMTGGRLSGAVPPGRRAFDLPWVLRDQSAAASGGRSAHAALSPLCAAPPIVGMA